MKKNPKFRNLTGSDRAEAQTQVSLAHALSVLFTETGSELCGEDSGIGWRDIRSPDAVHEALEIVQSRGK